MGRGKKAKTASLTVEWGRYMWLSSCAAKTSSCRESASRSDELMQRLLARIQPAGRKPGRSKEHASEVENIVFRFTEYPTDKQAHETVGAGKYSFEE